MLTKEYYYMAQILDSGMVCCTLLMIGALIKCFFIVRETYFYRPPSDKSYEYVCPSYLFLNFLSSNNNNNIFLHVNIYMI